MVNGNVEVLVFDDYEPPRANFGLEVFNDAGQVMYNSDWPVMKVRRLIVIPPKVPLFMSNTTYTVSGIANTHDIALAMTHNRDYYHGSSDGYSMTVGGRKTADGFVFSLICYASESESFPGGGAVRFTGYLVNEPLTVLAIDTSNLPSAPFGWWVRSFNVNPLTCGYFFARRKHATARNHIRHTAHRTWWRPAACGQHEDQCNDA